MLQLRPVAAAALALLLAAPAWASPELARSKNCIACHHLERHMNGPAFKAIAGRYADDPAAVERLSAKVLAGGSGQWGPSPMPPQSSLSQEEAEGLVRWILSQR
jgi:cytochrome c